MIQKLLETDLLTFTAASLGIIVVCSIIIDVAKILSDYPLSTIKKRKHKE